ncbi:MAG: MFS transporter [Polyangiaceae bacterium]
MSAAEDRAQAPREDRAPRSERAIVYLIAAVQFVNVLDFMMVNPLGPEFMRDLEVPGSELPTVVGSYTAAASITGVLGSLYLERFDRRSGLVAMLLGLAVGTALGGLAFDLKTLILARVVAGLFGGPATSLALAIVSDAVDARRRGWAMGIVMGGFAVASVLGVPAGLNLARLGGWRTPFFSTAVVIAIVAAVAFRLLPPLRAHLRAPSAQAPLRDLLAILKKRSVLLSLSLTTVTMMSSFIVIPNIPVFVEFNLGLPHKRLDVLYLLGGIASFATTRLTGPLVDRFGAARVAAAGTLLAVAIVWLWFVQSSAAVPILVVSTAFFVAMGMRGVAYNTLTSKVPESFERARFQSAQSAVQHGASAAAAFLSARLLSTRPDGSLDHVQRVGTASIVLCLLMPVFMLIVEHQLRTRAAAEPTQ